MTRYRLLYEDQMGKRHTLLREEPAETDTAALMKMLMPHPELNRFRPSLSPPGEDRRVVLERYDEGADRWKTVETLQQTRGGWSR
jgi:hypothetical protein